MHTNLPSLSAKCRISGKRGSRPREAETSAGGLIVDFRESARGVNVDVDVCDEDEDEGEDEGEEEEEDERTLRRTISSTTRFILFFISTLRDESLRKCDSVQLVAIFNIFASKSCAVGNGRLRVFSFPHVVAALAADVAVGADVAAGAELAATVEATVGIELAAEDAAVATEFEARMTSCNTTSQIPSLQTPSLPLLLFAKHHPNLAGPISHTSLFNPNNSSVLTPACDFPLEVDEVNELEEVEEVEWMSWR